MSSDAWRAAMPPSRPTLVLTRETGHPDPTRVPCRTAGGDCPVSPLGPERHVGSRFPVLLEGKDHRPDRGSSIGVRPPVLGPDRSTKAICPASPPARRMYPAFRTRALLRRRSRESERRLAYAAGSSHRPQRHTRTNVAVVGPDQRRQLLAGSSSSELRSAPGALVADTSKA